MSNWCICGTCDSCIRRRPSCGCGTCNDCLQRQRGGSDHDRDRREHDPDFLDLRLTTKRGLGDVFPDGFKESSWRRTEPLITPEKLRSRFLFGIDLVSGFKNTLTGKRDRITDDLIMDYIDRAVSQAEIQTGLTIFESKYEAAMAWDKCEYESFGYFRIEQRPVQSIERLTINLSNGEDIFFVPLDWIDTKLLHKGQLNIIPLTIALTTGHSISIPTTAGGATMLQVLGNRPWIAQFWKISCTLGFPCNELPKVINDLIGTIAALEVLSMLAATYARSTSTSLSIDAMSQSISNPGPALFTPRINDLEAKRLMLIGKIKAYYGLKLFSSNV
jgi:hypothetical protein